MAQGQTISWGRIAVGLLIVINLALVIVLMRPSEPVEVTQPPPVVTPSLAPAPSPTPETQSPEPSGDPTEASVIDVAPPQAVQRIIAPISANTAWRATTGTCQAPGVLHLTTDGGATWEDITPEGAGVIQRIRPDSEASGFIIATFAADASLDPADRELCETMLASTGSSGETWGMGTGSLGGAWYIDPTDRDIVSGTVAQAVTVCTDTTIDLAGISTSVAHVLCASGDIHTTTDGGQEWDVSATVSGARAFTGSSQSLYVAAWDAEASCEGIGVYSVDGDEVVEVGCVGAEAVTEDPTLVETVAIGVLASDSEDDLWVWLGDAVLRVSV